MTPDSDIEPHSFVRVMKRVNVPTQDMNGSQSLVPSFKILSKLRLYPLPISRVTINGIKNFELVIIG